MHGVAVKRQLFRSGIAAVLSAAAFAAPSFAQTAKAPACSVEGLDIKKLAKAKPDLGALPGIALGRQVVDEAIAAIEFGGLGVEPARARIPAARDACAGALTSKTTTIGNLPGHLCVALSDYALRRDDAAKCRVDWIDFLGSKLKVSDQRNQLLGDAWEAKGKILIAQQDLNGAQSSYQRAVGYLRTVPRLFNLAQLHEKRSETSEAISIYDELSKRPEIGEKKYDVLRNWATLVSNTSASVADKRDRWDALRQYRSTPEANLRYAETFLRDGMGANPDPKLTEALNAATAGSVNDTDTVQANARSVAWYYRAVLAARSAASREAWRTVAQYAGDGSAAPRATRLKCIAEVASGSKAGSCPSDAATTEQFFLRGVMSLRAAQFLPPGCTAELRRRGNACTENYSTEWLRLVGQAKASFSSGRDKANERDVLDWLEQGEQDSPRLQELVKAGEAIAQDWQTTRPGFANCTKFPAPSGLDPKAREVFNKLDLLNCAHS